MTILYKKLIKIGCLAILSLAFYGCSSEQPSSEATVQSASNNVEPSAAVKSAVDSEARIAMLELLSTIEQVQEKFLQPANGIHTADDVAEGQKALAHILETALYFWLESDPDRPVFKPYVTASRKLLGDNPDSIYYFAPIRDNRSYKISGNIGAAVFTSFTIEAGSFDGHAGRRSVAALKDNDMVIAGDGSYEIMVSRDKPASGNWLPLEDGASQITTRHYHEAKLSVAADESAQMDIRIEALDPVPLKPNGGDQEVANHLRYVANFVREHGAMSLLQPTEEAVAPLGWYSLVPNQFGKPGQWVSASGDQAYGNTHAYYNAANYELAADEALIIEGRLPPARFINVVLWNRFMQSYDFSNRQISLNQKQIQYEDDGSFKIIVAHQDPGLPNWLDTEGRPTGNMYWRFVFPTENPQTPTTRVVKFSELAD
jgi:hypothetical protein